MREMREWVLKESSGPVGRVRLNRAERYNAFTGDMLIQLTAAVREFAADERVRAVLIEGSGKAFCAGADLQAVAAFPTALARVVQEYHRAIREIYLMPKPVVTSINGVAAGGGFSLAIAGDYRIASHEARLTLAYMKAGLTIDGGSSWRLKHLVGLAQTQRLVFANPTLSAADAQAMGLIHEIVPPDALEREAMNRAAELAAGPTHAYAAIKELLMADHGLDAALKAEEERIVAAACTIDAREGIDAFIEKRPPQFFGR
jgi:2-(1,2-epoxy-1,2-dihydrophenyl)acetyl-CoA isomerase